MKEGVAILLFLATGGDQGLVTDTKLSSILSYNQIIFNAKSSVKKIIHCLKK